MSFALTLKLFMLVALILYKSLQFQERYVLPQLKSVLNYKCIAFYASIIMCGEYILHVKVGYWDIARYILTSYSTNITHT